MNSKTKTIGLGTRIYIPPEVKIDNMRSFKSDIWSLGLIIY